LIEEISVIAKYSLKLRSDRIIFWHNLTLELVYGSFDLGGIHFHRALLSVGVSLVVARHVCVPFARPVIAQ
jgi:hypothetical protein